MKRIGSKRVNLGKQEVEEERDRRFENHFFICICHKDGEKKLGKHSIMQKQKKNKGGGD